MIKNIRFRNTQDQFQQQLKEDIKKINSSTKAFIPADKTTNLYKLDKDQYRKLLHNSITATYKKADENTYDIINKEAKDLATKLKIEDRMECMAKQQAFITLKDHKENFEDKPTCRLINPAKSELGLVSKKIIEQINTIIRNDTRANQWKNSASVIEWFKSIPNKSKQSFIIFDIDNFYPSISADLLRSALDYAKQFVNIPQQDIDIIMHARKSLLFEENNTWIKKGNENMFDVTMGSYDGAEICELVGLYILNKLSTNHSNGSIGLYRDDGLAAFNNISGPQADKIKKDITKCFKDHGLKITIKTNLKIVNFLDVTFNLTNGTYYPYMKPNNTPLYINTKSNHPPTIIRHLPGAINRRISDISCNQDTFDKAKPRYEEALQASGYQDKLSYTNSSTTRRKRNRKRKTIWFNPPFNKAVQTNIGKNFLYLIEKHFPIGHRLNKIFNKNTVKVSYSCTQNMARIISKHNSKVINDEPDNAQITCNCRKKEQCPLENNCLTPSIVYNAHVTTEENIQGKNYIGLTEGTFKQRYTKHKHSFQHKKHINSTELSKYVWELKKNNKNHSIKWSTIVQAKAYSNGSKRCNLCLSEKLCIIKADSSNLLNKRDEMISKCRHENKFYIKNYKSEVT